MSDVITGEQSMNEMDEQEFLKHFHDVRKNYKPEKGEVLASWQATADFVDGWVKRNVMEMLATQTAGAESAVTVLRNVVGAIERDSIRVCKEIAEDLLSTMTLDEILAKPYRFTLRMFYWVKPEYVPKSPHWTTHDTKYLTDPEQVSSLKKMFAENIVLPNTQ